MAREIIELLSKYSCSTWSKSFLRTPNESRIVLWGQSTSELLGEYLTSSSPASSVSRRGREETWLGCEQVWTRKACDLSIEFKRTTTTYIRSFWDRSSGMSGRLCEFLRDVPLLCILSKEGWRRVEVNLNQRHTYKSLILLFNQVSHL